MMTIIIRSIPGLAATGIIGTLAPNLVIAKTFFASEYCICNTIYLVQHKRNLSSITMEKYTNKQNKK